MANNTALEFDPRDWKAFKRALKRNPRKARQEALKFLAKGIAVYNRKIIRNPWAIGGSGGGAPVDTGNLRDTHVRTKATRGSFQAKIEPTAPYAQFVHEGTSRMQPRPWLEYAKKKGQPEIDKLAKEMLKNITKDLGK